LQCVSTITMEILKKIRDDQKFKNKYRISSARLKNYNYEQNGAYFITICTQNRGCYFGKIENKTMELSKIGKMLKIEWTKTPEIRKNVLLGEWIIMPNHFHAIIIIENNVPVETHCNASLKSPPFNQAKYKNTFGPQSNNLSAIIRGFKGSTTKQIHIAGFQNFAWQTRFHDHIIHNDDELNFITEYIEQNPYNWKQDNFFYPI
jgi:putative transposase